MIQRILDSRHFLACLLSAATGMALYFFTPFPEDNIFLRVMAIRSSSAFLFFKYSYTLFLYTTPYIAFSILFSGIYIFALKAGRKIRAGKLPLYPASRKRAELSLVVGEVHHPRKQMPSETPRWLVIPERGLFTGIAIVGAVGSGKTASCMYPFAEQILAYRAEDLDRRIGGLILEVKGDFCGKVQEILARHGRAGDYVEISLESEYRYNPLHNDLDAYALAYNIASLLNNLFGRGKEPFWQQAYTNLVKFIILLHKVNYDYVTLFDVYECAINPDKLETRIKEGERLFQTTEYILVSEPDYFARRELARFPFEKDPPTNEMKASISAELLRFLDTSRIPFSLVTETGRDASSLDERKRQQLAAVKRWFYHDWRRIEPKLRTSIVEGISEFLSLFDDNPSVKYTFCPPKELYNAELNQNGRYGTALPPFSEMLEQGKVCALNFPVSLNHGLARTIGTLMKQDFQRAVLNRIPKIESHPHRSWREVLFLCDEYQGFATVGESDPTGDEKFFGLSRQAKCIPIVATQSISSLRSTLPGESWRTLLQTF